jgi:hypothetical protein
VVPGGLQICVPSEANKTSHIEAVKGAEHKDTRKINIETLGIRSFRSKHAYRLELCAHSFLHALFPHRFFGMVFLVRRTRVGCEGRSSRSGFELYVYLFLYKHLLEHIVPTTT